MAISVEEPLISHRNDELDDGLRSELSDADDVGVEWPAGRPGLFIWLLTLSAGISTSLSGKELTSLDKSAVTSCTALFALIASPISSVFADRFGRKPVILLSDLLFVFGALVQALSTSVLEMVLGRSIVGAAVGAASFVTPLYIAELAPPAYRGRLVTMNVLSITLGQVVAYIIGWIFAEHGDPSTGWRWMVGLGALPAILQCILLLLMPETPRWLVKAGKSTEARKIIEKTLGSDAHSHRFLIDSVVKGIEMEIREEQGNATLATNGRKSDNSLLQGWHELLRVPKNRRALVIACLLQGLQQLCGFNSLMYFSATIFTMLGFSIPTLTSLTVAATNFAFTVLALVLIDRIGRRRILLYSIPFMTIGLFLSAFGFSLIKLPSGATSIGDHIPVTADAISVSARQAAIVILISIMIYVASYALGLGNVPWMQSELFPLNVRSLGSGLATATNWLANFVIGLTFLPL
ncbi:hypothetical protein Hte_003514 [Hypoxylon texense]